MTIKNIRKLCVKFRLHFSCCYCHKNCQHRFSCFTTIPLVLLDSKMSIKCALQKLCRSRDLCVLTFCLMFFQLEKKYSVLNTTTEVPLSKTPNPQLLLGQSSVTGCPYARGVCSLLCECTLDGLNAEHKF